MKILLKWSDNWADEMDVDGFCVMDKATWKENKATISKYKDEFEIGIGTNESIEYANGKEFLETIEEVKITEEQAIFLIRAFGEEFGTFPLEQCLEIIEDIEEEDEEETDEFDT